MFCPKCGAQVPDGSPFCSSCGAQMGAQQPQQPVNQGGTSFNKPAGAGSNPFDFNEIINSFKANISNIGGLGIAPFIALGGAALLIVSIFLPFISVKVFGITTSASLLKGGALHWLIAIVIALCSAFVAISKKTIPMLVQGGIAVVYAIFEGIFQKETLVSLAAGFYVMLIAALAIAAGGVMQFLQEKKG
ncbi:MAG: zinc-ribbon domain-containing protein [Ruminococcus sp.]|nr:zinc-ribbon domain-containing protein [Ruminococcus sp.]